MKISRFVYEVIKLSGIVFLALVLRIDPNKSDPLILKIFVGPFDI